VAPGWTLIAYLCIGYPEEEHLDRNWSAPGGSSGST